MECKSQKADLRSSIQKADKRDHSEHVDEEDELFLTAGASDNTMREAEQQKHRKVAAASGLSLDLPRNRSEQRSSQHEGAEEKIISRLQAEILVVFELPDGSTGEEQFQMGQTVDFIKGFVQREYGIAMLDQQLYYENKLMLDPLSLCDYTANTREPMYVRVEGEMEADAKK